MPNSTARLWPRWILDSARRFGWAPVSVMGMHLVASKGTRAYANFAALDIVLHFLGGIAIGFFFWRAVGSASGARVLGSLSASGRSVMTFGLAGTATVVWECVEWSTDRLGLTHAQAGLPDTMLDMAMGMAGGLLVIAIGCMRRAPT